MGRRLGTLRGTLGLAIAALLAVAACGGANPDPYAVLDQARTANYDRIQVSLGFTANVAAQTDPNFPEIQVPATSINVDPSWITASADIPTGRWHVRLAVPLDALGMGNLGPFGVPFDAVDLEALSDGTDLYVQSPLLPMALQGAGGPAVEGDLTGWVRLGPVEALAPLGGAMFPFGLLGMPAPPALDFLPAPGDAAALRTFLTELGGTVEFAGTESVDGAELVHLKGGLNIVTLLQSQPFMNLTGMGRDQLQGIAEMEGRIGISTNIWVNKASGRLTTLRIAGTSIEPPLADVVVILRIAEPGPEITFEAPTAFTDIDLADLIGNPFPGVGFPGGGVGEGEVVATLSPEEQEIIDDILDEVGEELGDDLPTTP